jgi:hypothetical protein
MAEHVRLMPDGENHSVLNIGYGLGIVSQALFRLTAGGPHVLHS